MSKNKIILGNKTLECPSCWTIIDAGEAEESSGFNTPDGDVKYYLFNAEENLIALIWFSDSDFRGCQLKLTYKSSTELDKCINDAEEKGGNFEAGVRHHHRRRVFYDIRTLDINEFFQQLVKLLNSPTELSGKNLYLKPGNSLDVDAEMFQIKIHSNWIFSDEEILQIAKTPYIELQNSLVTTHIYTATKSDRKLSEKQCQILIDNSPFDKVLERINQFYQHMQKLKDDEKKRLQSLSLIEFHELMFDEAHKQHFAPEVSEKDTVRFYYKDAVPEALIKIINEMFGIKVLTEEQFIRVDDEDKFEELFLRFSMHINDINSPDYVISCKPWMDSIKNATPPCYKSWDELEKTGSEEKRYCHECEKHVYHVNTVDEIREHVEARHCIAFRFELGLDDIEEFVGDPY